MLKLFKLENYKNFKNTIVLDFSRVGGYKFNKECIIDNKYLGKIIIYGRNATGKTNLGAAIGDITFIIDRMGRSTVHNNVTNADSHDDVTSYYYEFEFDGTSIIYEYYKDCNCELVRESLAIDNHIVYDMDFKEKTFRQIYLERISAETIQIERYIKSIESATKDVDYHNELQNLPFLRYLINNTVLPKNSIILKLERYIGSMSFFVAPDASTHRIYRTILFNNYLEDPVVLQDFQEYLNAMGVNCKLRYVKDEEGNRKLYFIHGNRLLEFSSTASSGTKMLASLYFRYFATRWTPSFLYLDEFDAFYNYELAEKIVRLLMDKYPGCQMVFTTHNTNLMTNHIMRPDCYLILSRDGKLTALCDATERELREGHNLEKLYQAGEFGAYE